jgi:hypothetical protein
MPCDAGTVQSALIPSQISEFTFPAKHVFGSKNLRGEIILQRMSADPCNAPSSWILGSK